MEIQTINCVLFAMHLCILLDKILACSTMHDACQRDKRFQRVSVLSSVETEKAYDLLLQRICYVEDSIQRYNVFTLLIFTSFISALCIHVCQIDHDIVNTAVLSVSASRVDGG